MNTCERCHSAQPAAALVVEWHAAYKTRGFRLTRCIDVAGCADRQTAYLAALRARPSRPAAERYADNKARWAAKQAAV